MADRSLARERLNRARLMVCGLMLTAPALMAPSFVTIYNGPNQAVGDTSYYNAENLGTILTGSNLIVVSDEATTVADAVDLSSGGAAYRNFTLRTQTVNLGFDLTMGTGNLIFEADAVNLTGRALGFDGVDTITLGASRLGGTATQVNVLGEAALIGQALAISAADAAIEVLDGVLSSDLNATGSRTVNVYGGTLDGGSLLAGDSSLIRLFGSGFELDTGSGFQPVGLGPLAPQSGTLRGTLESGDLFETEFHQGGGGFTGSIVLTPEPHSAALLGLGLASMGVLRRRRRYGGTPATARRLTGGLIVLGLTAAVLPAPAARAGFLEGFTGHTRARNTAGTADQTFAFAVLDRLTGASSAGDVFGTGLSNFDTSAASGSDPLDTSARYLYLFQDLNDGSASDSISSFEFPVVGLNSVVANAATSVAHWDLVLKDDLGAFSVSNQFGPDGAPFQFAAFAVRGVTSPGVTAPGASLLASDSFSYNSGTGRLVVSYSPALGPGAMGPLYGFTSDLPPAYFSPVNPAAGDVTGEFPVGTVTGGFMADLIGNTRARNYTVPATRDETWSFAVLDRLSSASAAGDVYGTGIPSFDADTGIDTSARFLYLYQDINDGILGDPIPEVNVPANGASSSSLIQEDLIFTDDGGEFTTTNQFGSDGAAHVPNASASIGVADPGLAAPSGAIEAAATSFDPGAETFTIHYDLGGDPGLEAEPGEIGPIYGFTSNHRPVYAKPFGQGNPGDVNGDAPVPLPEPSGELMLAFGIAGALALRRCRTESRRRG